MRRARAGRISREGQGGYFNTTYNINRYEAFFCIGVYVYVYIDMEEEALLEHTVHSKFISRQHSLFLIFNVLCSVRVDVYYELCG